MTVIRRVVLPAFIGLLAIAVVVTGLVGASGIRADQRKAAAIAKEKKAVADYKKAAQPLVIAVFDAVQPLQDAGDAFESPRPGLTGARDDVLAHSGASSDLHALAVKLKALGTPKRLATEASGLRTDLDTLITASNTLAAATQAKGDVHGFVAAFDDGFTQLLTAETTWINGVQDVYGSDTTLPVPTAERVGAHGRRIPTKGGFIHAADLACAKGLEAFDKLPDLPDDGELRTNIPKENAIFRSTIASLLKVPAPSSATFLHQLQVQLKASLALATANDQLRAAYLRRDVNAFKAAARSLDASLNAMRAVARTYKAQGVTECQYFFQVDPPSSKAGSGGTATA